MGQLTSTTDPLLRVTSYVNDVVGNVTAKIDHGGNCGTTPVGCTKFSYDVNNQLKTIVYSDKVTPNVSYSYDALGRRTSMTDGTGTSTYSYDSLGRLVSSKDGAGAVVGYEYDRADRQTGLIYPGGKKVLRTFNSGGQITAIRDWVGRTNTFSYDQNSQPVNTNLANGVVGTSSYDPAGQLKGIKYTNGTTVMADYTAGYDGAGQVNALGTGGAVAAPTVSYSYDQVNRLTNVNGTAAYGYDAADNPIKVAGGITQAFNAANELVSSTKAGNTTYKYDTRGNRISATPAVGSATTMAYDQANRLKSAAGPGYSTTYRYNGDGTRASKTVGTATQAFTWDASTGLPMLLADSTSFYVYDPYGLPLVQVGKTDGQTHGSATTRWAVRAFSWMPIALGRPSSDMTPMGTWSSLRVPPSLP